MPEQVLKAGTRPPWVGLAAAIWVLFAAGNNYNFALFSPALKSVLGYNQQQIAILGVANDIGPNAGLLAGIAVNHFPPWVIILLGSVTCFLGYGVIWLAVTQTVQNMPYYLLWVVLLIGTSSVSWFQTAVVVTNMRNFPRSRGTVSGILKAYVGLSAAMYAVMYSTLLDKSVSALLSSLALGLPIICSCYMYFIRRCEPSSADKRSEELLFSFTQVASILLAIYLLAITIFNDKFSVGRPVSYMFFCIMVLFMFVPFAIPIKMTLFPANAQSVNPSSEQATLSEGSSDGSTPETKQASAVGVCSNLRMPLLNGHSATSSFGDITESKEASQGAIFPASNGGSDLTKLWMNGSSSPSCPGSVSEIKGASQDEGKSDQAEPLLKEHPSNVSLPESGCLTSNVNLLLAYGYGAKPHRGENFKFQQAILKADFWLLWLVYFLGVGPGVTVLNNLSQIGYAYGECDTTILLSLFAFFNFTGRLGGGDLSERISSWKSIPRSLLLMIVQAVMVLSFVLYIFSHGATLYLATVLLGICYGVHSSVMIPTASDLFGTEHVGLIYNFIQLGNPIGAVLFSALLAGKLYDAEAKKQGVTTCMGPTCFRLTFVILAGVSVVGFILGLILTLRIRPVYEKLYRRDRCPTLGD